MNELSSAIEAILFAAGESVPVARISLVLGEEESAVEECAAITRENGKRFFRIMESDR